MSDVYELICNATLAGQQVVATYKGHRRELCPHVLGTKDGRRQALFFQFGGGSSTSLPPGGEWRCIPVDGLEDVVVRDGRGTRAATISIRRRAWTRSTSRRRGSRRRARLALVRRSE